LPRTDVTMAQRNPRELIAACKTKSIASLSQL
jgi:hypothetical protein